MAAFASTVTGQSRYEICGPETPTGEDMAENFSRALGRKIKFRPMPPREFGEILNKVAGGGGDAVASFYESVFADPTLLSTAIDHLSLLADLPIRPTTLSAFASSHAAEFSPTPSLVLPN